VIKCDLSVFHTQVTYSYSFLKNNPSHEVGKQALVSGDKVKRNRALLNGALKLALIKLEIG
jgi:hypothetical protein